MALASEEARRVFRLDNEILAFRFTATLSDRRGPAPRERLDDAERLKLWLGSAGLDVGDASPSDLNAALDLREAIYRIGKAIATTRRPDPEDVRTLNKVAATGHAVAILDRDAMHWRLTESAPVHDALSVLATDAIRVFGASERNRIKLCEGPDCAGLFLDTSRGANRRWCSMNTCGNKAKKSRLS